MNVINILFYVSRMSISFSEYPTILSLIHVCL